MDKRADVIGNMVQVCHRLYDKGFVTATDGNISVRYNDNFLTTCTSVNKGSVTAQHIIEVDRKGKVIHGRFLPSTELKMHLFIYQKRKDINAIVHAHPVYATGFATARMPLPQNLFPEVIINLKEIPLAPYATPGTDDLAQSLAPYIKHAEAMLLTNHGVVACGKDIWDAYYKLEKVEHAAQISYIARMLGGEKPLSRKEVQKLRKLKEHYSSKNK
ncbi:MAG: class II aldolase/adducin family protein [Bacteroidota bacterium]